MSPNGTLMAYSTPVDIKELRDQAALVSMVWKEQTEALQAKRMQEQTSDASDAPRSLETLTIEFDTNNIIVRALQPALLLVLVGGVPPNRKKEFKMTAEVHGDPRYPKADDAEELQGLPANHGASQVDSIDGSLQLGQADAPDKSKAASVMSHMSQKEKDLKAGVLHIHRKKIDGLTEYIRKEFDSAGFTMPDDTSFA
jgi:hypothetical protein